jgi:hypothetical protein
VSPIPINSYPIAMSVRSTNVYEERSLGVFEAEDDVEPDGTAGAQAVAKYLGWHARRQLAFGGLCWPGRGFVLGEDIDLGPAGLQTSGGSLLVCGWCVSLR